MKHYSYLWSISYDVIILVCYDQGKGSDCVILKFFILCLYYILFTFDVINCYVHFKMFRYNPKANYQPNGDRYLKILSGKDLYKQTVVVSAGSHGDTFPARFPNIFVDYPLGQMRVGDKLWKNWNKAPLKLWQTQLHYAVFCASSA